MQVHAGFPSPASASTAGYPLQLSGLSRKHNHWCWLTFPNQYSQVDWSNVTIKFLNQGNNSKQHHLGINPESPGSQADPKLYRPLLPHTSMSNIEQVIQLEPSPVKILHKLSSRNHTHSMHPRVPTNKAHWCQLVFGNIQLASVHLLHLLLL